MQNILSHISPRLIKALTCLWVFIIMFVLTAPSQVGAIAVSSFDSGRIIDDSVFTDRNSMNAAQIQSFLNNKVPSCDTYGTQPSEYGGGTRAQWGQAKYGQGVFICLRNYSENGRSAAQIIFDTAQQYRINPQVLLVLLQKEQGLVTDTWPLNIQYRSATGYGCPDTAPCDSQYYGLTNQLDWSAKMFRAIINASPGWYTPYILGNNYIRYNPNASCGGSMVTIQNRSTQALYNYTPYQPNSYALNGGTSSAYPQCGAFGNRNFYTYFTSWFGSTRISGPILQNSLGTNKLTTNMTLRSGDFLVSPNGKFVTTMQYDGNLVTYAGDRPIWHTQTYGNYGAYATFQSDGNLVVYTADNSVLWNSRTWGVGANSLTLEDNGRLHIYTDSVEQYNTGNQASPYALNKIGDQMTSGAKLNAGDYLLSPDQRYSLVMQNDGNLVLYSADSTALWSSRTWDNPGAYAKLQADGNLVVYDKNNRALWNTYTFTQGASVLKMQNDGNLVVYRNSDGWFTWASGTQFNFFQVNNYVGNQISSQTTLNPGDYLRSPDYRYRLVMEAGGDLVLYSANKTTALWSSRTWDNPGAYAKLQADGNLVVYDKNNRALWNTYTFTQGASVLKMQNDGNLVVYRNSDGWFTWASGTQDYF